MATPESICKFNQSGFCKFQSHCRKQHIMEICSNTQCSMVTCIYRHPRVCRYFSNFGRCKFSDSCSYLHEIDDKISELRSEQGKEIEKLRQEVEELHKQVEDLRNQISNQANFQSQAALVKSSINSNCSSITMVKSYHSNPQAKLGPVIPQLDGTMNSFPPSNNTIPFETQNQPADVALKCETCHKTFETEEQFHEHDAAHQFCCDECFICFTTKVMADLHELEEHPNTHYADTYIPQSTKLLFACGQPRNPPTH